MMPGNLPCQAVWPAHKLVFPYAYISFSHLNLLLTGNKKSQALPLKAMLGHK
jgi:hypothetical protein